MGIIVQLQARGLRGLGRCRQFRHVGKNFCGARQTLACIGSPSRHLNRIGLFLGCLANRAERRFQFDRETDHFRIFVEGLSGEFIERPNPAATAETPEDEKVIRLRKTLVLEYKFPGDIWWLNVDQPVFVSKTWTWR